MILAHRGIWKKRIEQNTMIAFRRAFIENIGIETDVRDSCGKLVVSHDIPGGKELLLSKFFEEYKNNKNEVMLALNIKSNGLSQKLKVLIEQFKIKNYFCFDMSYPDLRDYNKYELYFYSRISEFEKQLFFFNNCKGVWIDAFDREWYTKKTFKKFIDNKKDIAIVSSELHKRDYKENWIKIKNMELPWSNGKTLLCTDHPFEALKFFKELK